MFQVVPVWGIVLLVLGLLLLVLVLALVVAFKFCRGSGGDAAFVRVTDTPSATTNV